MLQQLVTACQYLNRWASAQRYIDECISLAEDTDLLNKLISLRDINAKKLAQSNAAAQQRR
jgi:hypothetical protein